MHGFFAAQARRRVLMMLALGAACTSAPALAQAAEPLRVVASFSVLGDMVREIGGPDVTVATLVGPDGDAHEYEPTPAAARQLAGAAVLVENGLGFETWLPRLAKAAGFAGRSVVASAGITPRRLAGDAHGGQAGHTGAGQGHDGGHDHDHDHDDHNHHHDPDHDHGYGEDHDHGEDPGHDHDHGQAGGSGAAPAPATAANGAAAGGSGHHHHHHHGDLDPHAWQSLANGAVYARNIAAGLAAADPARAAAYRQRAEAYIARIEALDAQIRQTFAAIPAARRQVVSSHDAFGYFGDAYGVRFIAVAGLSTDAEPSAADLARIIEQVRREHVPAVFVENITSPALVRQIARETGARVGGTLYSDALAPPGQPAATYLGMFEWNARQLSAALRPQ